MTDSLTVIASRWKGGWELEISHNEHTQVRRLSHARQQVIDYLDTMYEDEDHSNWTINIIPDVGSLAQAIIRKVSK